MKKEDKGDFSSNSVAAISLEFLNSQQRVGVISAKLALASTSRNPGNTRKTGLPSFDAAQDMLSR